MAGVYTFKAAGTARVLAPEHTGPAAIGAVRLAVSTVVVIAYVLFSGVWPHCR